MNHVGVFLEGVCMMHRIVQYVRLPLDQFVQCCIVNRRRSNL